MFVYVFENPLFKGQYRKMALNFPLSQYLQDAFAGEGWVLVKAY